MVAKEPGFRDCRRCACLGLCLAYLKKNLRPRRVIKEPESLLFFFLFFPLFFSYRTLFRIADGPKPVCRGGEYTILYTYNANLIFYLLGLQLSSSDSFP